MIMTHNQIAWQNLLETMRSNLAREQEESRSHQASEIENRRHNFAWEGESRRHNVQNEQHSLLQLDELRRHNMRNESLSRFMQREVERHNRRVELNSLFDSTLRYRNAAELNRIRRLEAHQRNEIATRKNEIDQQRADTDLYRVHAENDLRKFYNETYARSVDKSLLENQRANLEKERLAQERLDLDRSHNLISDTSTIMKAAGALLKFII